jgi:predicted O-methyltransferase YrrM
MAVSEGKVVNDKGELVSLAHNVSLNEASTLYNLVRHMAPASTAEIGFAQGISTLALLQAQEHNNLGYHHVVDPFQSSWQNAGVAMVDRAKLGHRMTLHEKFPEEVFPSLPSLDFVFIDGSHLFDLTMLDFVLADKRLRVGGVIGFHDTWMLSIRKVLRYILTNRAYKPLTVSERCNLSKRQKVTRFVSSVVSYFPYRATVFNSRIVAPFHTLGLDFGNLVFVQKQDDDKRDWHFHAEF